MPQVREVEDGRYVFDLALPVRKVLIGDLDAGEWHQWLLRRIGETFPYIGEYNARGLIVSWINSNEHRLMRCGGSTALAARWMENPVERKPIVMEIFTFVEDKARPMWRRETTRLYREMQVWAANMKADGVKIGQHSDVTRGRLIEITGASEETELWLEAQRQ